MARRRSFDEDGDEIIEELTPASLGAAPAKDDVPRGGPRFVAPREVFADDDLMIIDKPAGLSLRSDDVEPGLLELLELEPPSAVVFPIDDGASGLVVIVRHERWVPALQEQIRDGRMIVRWLAIVRAALPTASGSIDQPLRIPRQPSARVHIAPERGEPAQTEWRLVEAFAGHAVIQCIARPILRHQLRAHLQAIGMPLVVDDLYGGGRELMLSSFKAGYRPNRRGVENPLLARLSLHVVSIELLHPATGVPLQFRADPPRDFRATIQQLGKYGRLPPPRT